jgi:hypothetical protein
MDEIKEKELRQWSKLYGRPLSEEEYVEICTNLSEFFATLKQWSDEEERMLAENGQSNDKRSIILSPTP